MTEPTPEPTPDATRATSDVPVPPPATPPVAPPPAGMTPPPPAAAPPTAAVPAGPPVMQSPGGYPMFANGKPAVDEYGQPVRPYSRLAAALLCAFLGFRGVHRFYVGKIGTGIAIILTLGGFFGIWPLVDLIMILVGSFRDKENRRLYNW